VPAKRKQGSIKKQRSIKSVVQSNRRKPKDSSFFIVGIGASAGGLAAFKEFLENLPSSTGMAFVIVQHLSPTHESMLSDILRRSTKMPVEEIKNKTRVEPNHVYIIPPDTHLSIQSQVLLLHPRDNEHFFLPIDSFFKSLAKDQRENAISIVLSGTGSDGAEGAKIGRRNLVCPKSGIGPAQLYAFTSNHYRSRRFYFVPPADCSRVIPDCSCSSTLCLSTEDSCGERR
jgi:two-component system CheB/CheR fusion protein